MSVFKNFPRRNYILLTAYISKTYFSIENSSDIDWRLTKDAIQDISGFECKKATCHFAGRDYVAWYTMQIPISEGPYKFNGLPGLIVKISDTSGEHQFELTKFIKVNNKVPIVYTIENYMKTDTRGLLKVYENHALKGVKNYKIKNLSKEDEIRMNKKIRSRNNFIEKVE